MWKEQLLRGGIHATSVIRHLLGRRDREYFKIANISLLFDTMDDMLLDMGMYTGFICQMFAIGTKRHGSLVKYGEGKVCTYDKFLSALNAILKRSNCHYVLQRIDFSGCRFIYMNYFRKEQMRFGTAFFAASRYCAFTVEGNV